MREYPITFNHSLSAPLPNMDAQEKYTYKSFITLSNGNQEREIFEILFVEISRGLPWLNGLYLYLVH